MSKDEKERDEQFAVNDKRQFQMDKDGNVTPKESEEPENTAEPDQANEKSGNGGNDEASEPDTAGCDQQTQDLPPMTFSTLILSLSTQAMISLGEIPDPMTKQKSKNIPLAKQSIDLLGILEEKTKGNLDVQEANFLKSSLTDLRLKFVNSCKD